MLFLQEKKKGIFLSASVVYGRKFNHLINNLVQMTFLKNEKGHDISTVLNSASPYS